MNKRLIYLIAILLSPIFSYTGVAQGTNEQGVANETTISADDDPKPIPNKQKKELIDSITKSYSNWKNISLSGKLSSSMLPVSASVKIYMEKNKLIVMSISAPIMGEVARLEIDEDRVIAVNKLKSKYSTLEMEEISTFCPGGLEAVQNLLLGRISLLGTGQLKSSDADLLDIYKTEYGDWLLLPNNQLASADYIYLYLINMNNLLLDKFMVMTQDGSPVGECDYEWSKKDYTINFLVTLRGKPMEMKLKLNSPDSSAKKLNRIDLSNKYREVAPKDLVK